MADDDAENDGRKGITGKMVNLEFVNMNAASAAERERNQKIIRSTAMKSFRRAQRSQRQEDEPGKTKKQTDTMPAMGFEPSNSTRGKKRVSGSASVPKFEPSARMRYSDISQLIGSPSSSSSGSSSGEEGSVESKAGKTAPPTKESLQAAYAMNEPQTLLGAGRVDPFRDFPADVNVSHAPELIDHSISVVWHGLRPPGENGSMSSLSTAWFREMRERPILLHAMLFGAQVHLDVLRSPRLSIDNPVRLYHKVQTMKLLKEELKSPSDIPLDDIILAVLTLSANEVETMANNIVDKQRSPFNSPLASMQWLDVYGSITHFAAHTTAMRSLVARRGGLENIELEGLVEVLSFSDILAATQTLQKPHWPLPKRMLTLEDIYIPEILKVPLRNLGQGFTDLIPFGITDELMRVIQALVAFTAVIDCHCRGAKPIANLTQCIDKRNVIQHQLMSLPLGEELVQGETAGRCIYESIRLANIIYSAAVTFPLPPLTGIFYRLARNLRNVLEESRSDPHWRSASDALMWILVLGGIAASATSERSWYVQSISTVSSAMKLAEWKQISARLRHFLWLESACDSAGRELWMEVKTFQSRRS